MSVELALAIPPTIDLCLKYGRELRTLCASLRNAETEIAEQVLRLDNGWLRWSNQLNFLQRIEHMLDGEHRAVFEQTLHVLLSKLETVTAILERLVRRLPEQDPSSLDVSYGPRRIKYAFKKNSLDKAIEELEIWQRVADYSWFLLMKMASPQVDVAIAKDNSSLATAIPSVLAIRDGIRDAGTQGTTNTPAVTFSAEELARMAIVPVPFCNARLARRSTSAAPYILNDIRCPHISKYQVVKKDTRDLARKLRHDEPQRFGLLSCKGFVVVVDNDAQETSSAAAPDVTFTMIFRTPPGVTSSPRSLRDLLLHASTPSSLSTRFDIARELAKSVSYVHSFGFVHKNIRPESVLSFDHPGGSTTTTTYRPAALYLAGFENFRREDGWTSRQGDRTVERNLYRHPSRQGSSPREDYVMQHDIYSLGVCLLEVGLWRGGGFIDYGPDGTTPTPSQALCLPPEATGPHVSSFLEMSGKDHLLSLTRSQLPEYMGTKYAGIVETCLTCLDPDNADFGDEREFEDADGIRVGARYIEKVLLRLNLLYV